MAVIAHLRGKRKVRDSISVAARPVLGCAACRQEGGAAQSPGPHAKQTSSNLDAYCPCCRAATLHWKRRHPPTWKRAARPAPSSEPWKPSRPASSSGSSAAPGARGRRYTAVLVHSSRLWVAGS